MHQDYTSTESTSPQQLKVPAKLYLTFAPITSIIISSYQSQTSISPKVEQGSFPDLARSFQTARSRGDCTAETCQGAKCEHKSGEAWAPYTLKPGRTRSAAAVESVTALVLDVDHLTNEEWDETHERIQSAGIAGFAHSTHSDKPGDRCLRIVFQLSRPMTPAELAPLRSGVSRALALKWDPKAADPSRIYFTPRHRADGDHTFSYFDGKSIDVDATLAAEVELRPLVSQTIRPQSIATTTSSDFLEIDDFTSAVEQLDQGYILEKVSGSRLVKGERITIGGTQTNGNRPIDVNGIPRAGFIDTEGRIAHANTRAPGERPDGGPLATTWLRHYNHSDQTIRQALCALVPELARFADDIEAPMLPTTMPTERPYPIDALGELSDVVREVAELVQAPIPLVAGTALATASLAVQPLADIKHPVTGLPVLASLNITTISHSGDRKTTVDRLLLNPVRVIQEEREAKRRRELEAFQQQNAEWNHNRSQRARKTENERRAILDLVAAKPGQFNRKGVIREAGCSPATVTALLSDGLLTETDGTLTVASNTLDKTPSSPGAAPPQAPPPAIMLAKEPTTEGIQRLLQAGASSLGLFNDEGAEFFGGFSMKPENMTRAIAVLSGLWSTGETDRVRASDEMGAVTLRRRRLAVHLALQPVVAQDMLRSKVLRGQGFLARFLIAQPQSLAGARLFREDNGPGLAREVFSDRIKALLRTPEPSGEGTCRGELSPRSVELSPSARALWIKYYNETEGSQGAGGEFEDMREFASRSPEQALRIAGVLTIYGDAAATFVDEKSMQMSIDLAKWYLHEAARIFRGAAIAQDQADAAKILEWARKETLTEVTSKQLAQIGPNCARSRERYGPAMAWLVREGHAEVATRVGKKPTRWQLNTPSTLAALAEKEVQP